MLQLERESFTITLVCFNTKGHVLAEEVGFEPTVPCGTSHFKCGALSQTQPLFLIIADVGIYPTFLLLGDSALFPCETALVRCNPEAWVTWSI